MRNEQLRDAVKAYLGAEGSRSAQDRVDLLDKLLIYPGSGKGDLARNSEAYLRQRFAEKGPAGSR